MTIDQYFLRRRIEELQEKNCHVLENVLSAMGNSSVSSKEWPDILAGHNYDVAILELVRFYNQNFDDPEMIELQGRIEWIVEGSNKMILEKLKYAPQESTPERRQRSRDICGND